ncbi:MAG: hypothetical protein ACK5RQ_13230 [Bacteroidota bacterium]
MISFAYSLAAHEKPNVLIDQIQNINRYNKKFSIIIVLHLSKIFELNDVDLKEILSQPNVIVNPERLITGFMDGSLYEAHLSNINLIYSKKINFGHIIFLASNMLFVRQMIEIKSDFIGNSHDAILHKGWFQAWMAVRDKNVNKFHLYGCQIEGLFISKNLLDRMLPQLQSISFKYLFINMAKTERNIFWNKIIRQWRKFRFKKWINTNYILEPIRFFTFSQLPFVRIAYATEEVYFPTIAKLFQDEFTFRGNVLSFQDWENSSIVTKDSVDWLRSSDNTAYVCTKRVDRIYDDPVRVYIRNLPDDI